MRNKFEDDHFKNSSITDAITPTFGEAVMLVLLMGSIYETLLWNGFSWSDTKFRDNLFRYSCNIKVITVPVLKAVMLVLPMWGINRLTVVDIQAHIS
jgi:hypothetical protein